MLYAGDRVDRSSCNVGKCKGAQAAVFKVSMATENALFSLAPFKFYDHNGLD